MKTKKQNKKLDKNLYEKLFYKWIKNLRFYIKKGLNSSQKPQNKSEDNLVRCKEISWKRRMLNLVIYLDL